MCFLVVTDAFVPMASLLLDRSALTDRFIVLEHPLTGVTAEQFEARVAAATAQLPLEP